MLEGSVPVNIAEVSTVSNGTVHSRAGTALVSMMAKRHSIPVVVCCEAYKISKMVQLDSFTKNELGTPIHNTFDGIPTSSSAVPAGPLNEMFATFPISIPRESLATENTPNLEILNPLYDLTPPRDITTVVTEVGVIPR